MSSERLFYNLGGEFCIVNEDCIETGKCDNFICTATQTTSKKNASVQTTQSIDSQVDATVQVGKSSSFSIRQVRNFTEYNKLEKSDPSRLSFDDESTQCKEKTFQLQ